MPGEAIGTTADAGAVNVLYGAGAGGLDTAGNQIWYQGNAGLLDAAEEHDCFGWVLAVGDSDGDGTMDLAAGVPYEDVGALNAAGAVHILYGSAAGLAAAGNTLWYQDVAGVEDTAAQLDRFGRALAAGDFNGDGYADLAVGVPWEGVGTPGYNAGAVNVLYGSAAGLTTNGNKLWHQDVADAAGANDNFGDALAAGDFNGDGYADLAVGVPWEDVGTPGDNAGAVNVLYGSAAGLTTNGNKLWHQDVADVADAAGANDNFGFALAAGDFDGDGRADLAVGVPYEDVIGLDADAGAVNVLYGSAAGLTEVGDQLWHQNSTDIGGAAETDDHFGWALAVIPRTTQRVFLPLTLRSH